MPDQVYYSDQQTGFQPVNAHVSNASLSSAVTLTCPAGANKLLIQAITANVRFTLDGLTVPTASVGFQLIINDDPTIIPISSKTIVQVIQESAGGAVQYQWGI